jgi:DNA helicase-2/ATP-dependent DNA helicase PcrA
MAFGAVKTFPAKHDSDCKRCSSPVTRGMEIALATPDDSRNTRDEWIVIGCPAPGCSNKWKDAISWWEKNAARLMQELPPPKKKATPRAPYQPAPRPMPADLTPPVVTPLAVPTATPDGPIVIPAPPMMQQPMHVDRSPDATDEEFAKRYAKLDQFQRPIADLNPTPGVTRVLANAGSGKTTTMVSMSSRWLREGRVDPDRLIIVTFTRKAGLELRARLGNVLPGKLFRAIRHIGTYDSLAGRAVMGVVPAAHRWDKSRNVAGKSEDGKSARAPGLMAELTYVSRAMGKAPIADLPGEWGLRLDPKECRPREYGTAIDVLMSQKFATTATPGAREAAAALKLDRLFEVWQLVERQHARVNAWTYATALAAFYKLIQTDPGGYTLIVDEAQDNSLLQIDICKVLAYGNSLTMVGDVRQAIYSWRGAAPELFAEEQRLALDAAGGRAKVQTVYLANNYRSAPQIVALGNAIAEGQSWDVGEPALPARTKDLPKGATVVVEEGGGPMIARYVRNSMDEGRFESSDCAVLCRVRAEQAIIEAQCLMLRIPVQIVGAHSTFDSAAWHLFQSWLFFAVSGGEVSHDIAEREAATKFILKAVDPIPNLGKTTATDVSEIVFEREATIQEALRVKANDARQQRQREACLSAATMLEAAMDKDMHKAARKVASGLQPLLEPEAAKKAKTTDDGGDDLVELLQKFVLIAEQFDSLVDLYNFAEQCRANTKRVDAEDDVKTGPLTISTIHKAKGLEWKVVFVMANEGKFPHSRSSGPAREEERRLFYVACTRAEDLLVVTYDPERKETFRGKMTITGGPSEYAELARQYDDQKDHRSKATTVTPGPSHDPDAPQLPPVTLQTLQAGVAPYHGDDDMAVGEPMHAADLITLLDAHADDRAAAGGSDRKIGAKTVEVTLYAVQEVLAPLNPRPQPGGTYRDGTPFQHKQIVYELPLIGGGAVVVYTSVPRGATVAKGAGEDSMRVVLMRGQRASGDALVQRTKNWRVALADRIRDALVKYGEG